jgi:hypothetical protein
LLNRKDAHAGEHWIPQSSTDKTLAGCERCVKTPSVHRNTLLDKRDAVRGDSVAAERPRFVFWALWWLIAIFSLWLRTGFPTHALSFANFDDELFIRGARYLGAGVWLGPYDNLTLAKGMFYPFFILIAFLSAIPLNMAEHVVYLAASVVAARLVLRLTNDRKLSLLLFAALAFNPVVWSPEMGGAIREGLYLSLSLAAVILAVNAVFPPPATRQWVTLAYGAALGLVLGAFWLTREEGLWLLPAVAVPAILSLSAAMVIQRPMASAALAWLKSIGLSLAVGITVFAACNGIVAGLNYAKYGVFITNEFRSGPFLRAYGALTRIKQDHWRPFVVFPKDARERAYNVSPAARELAAALDGPQGEAWRRVGCMSMGITDCPEILSGWFVWAFRDAVAAAGHYRSAPEAMRFYDELAREINAACASGRVPCGPPRATLMPVFHWQYLADTARDSLTVARILLTMANMQIGAIPSQGSPSGIIIFADTVGGVYPAHPTQLILRGWVASPSGKPELALKVLHGEQAEMTIVETPAPDVTQVYPGWIATRFEACCPPSACALVASAPGVPPVDVSLDQLRAGAALTTPQLRLFLDFASVRPSAAATTKRLGVQLRIAKVIAFCYTRAVPSLFALALFGSVLALARRRSRAVPVALAALLGASIIAIATRIVLLAYLDVTSFPSANIHYTSPATPFVIIFTVIGCWCLLRCVVSERLRRRLFADQFSPSGSVSYSGDRSSRNPP